MTSSNLGSNMGGNMGSSFDAWHAEQMRDWRFRFWWYAWAPYYWWVRWRARHAA